MVFSIKREKRSAERFDPTSYKQLCTWKPTIEVFPCIAVQIASKGKYTHFVRIFAFRGEFDLEGPLGKKNKRNSQFRFTIMISHLRFTIFVVNCAFLFVSFLAYR